MADRAVRVQGFLAVCGALACGCWSPQAVFGAEPPSLRDVVGVAVVRSGQSVLLATPGLEEHGRQWRFRSLDTSAVPQTLHEPVLSATGTKLFLETGADLAVLDLIREYQHNVALQYVAARDVSVGTAVAATMHRLPSQRFVSIRPNAVRVVDDVGFVQAEYAVEGARLGAVSGDGTVLYLRSDGSLTLCDRPPPDLNACRSIGGQDYGEVVAVMGGPGGTDPQFSRFLLLTGRADATRIVDPEHPTVSSPPLRRAEAALRASLILHRVDVANEVVSKAVDSLLAEARATIASAGEGVVDWRFFQVKPDEELYAPVLQFARRESAYPDVFETLEMLGGTTAVGDPHRVVESLRGKYLRLTIDERRDRCTIYYRTISLPGSWIIQYWFYYPFDIGGLGSHLHDPEHLFVEVDKLGGTVRRVIGAGHGYIAGNNIYAADRPGALPVDLPLHAMVELGKHATATDIDHDGIFTPGLDENEYKERAKIWGVRDVIGTINNQLVAYDRTMSAVRFAEDALAPLSVTSRFPHESALADRACCQVLPLPEGRPELRSCPLPTTDCAQRSVISHPDAKDPTTILKDWVFPHAFLRAIYGLGPRQRLHSAGIAYVVDLYRFPGLSRLMPMPGRVGGEIYGWHQDVSAADLDSCLADCERVDGIGVGVRYEQFISNLFGIYSAIRVYSPPIEDVWITFGPMVEVPLFNESNLNFQAGLSFRPYASPRFEMKVNLGLWKPTTSHFGIEAGSDEVIQK